jgi:hypothetical protein
VIVALSKTNYNAFQAKSVPPSANDGGLLLQHQRIMADLPSGRLKVRKCALWDLGAQ